MTDPASDPVDPTTAEDRSAAERDLLDRWADIAALDAAAAVLGWDQETYLPPKGQPGRGRVLAALAGLHHDKLTDPALAAAIEAAGAEAAPGSVLEAQVREARRAVVRATAVPADLARRLAELQSRALASWQRARAEDDLAVFAPDLAELVVLVREQADALVAAGVAERPYDALLDGFEPGATEAALVPVLGALRDDLAPIVRAVAEQGTAIDESPCLGTFPEPAQRAFVTGIAEAMGYDFDAGRLDASAHPFTTSFNPSDVRITWRWQDDDIRPGLFGVMHEAGHGLYEQGLPAAWEGTPIGAAVSLGVHESQSRLWENLVGRSRPFWEWALPRYVAAFPDRAGTSADAVWRALHTVTPSLIRVEADEATYNLHIVARFEIERALFAGELGVDDLRGAWDDAYAELLGVRPTGVADGVLQDIHWSMGAFGYFPTYTLGNLLAAQLFDAARADLATTGTDLDELLATGRFAPLLAWLREHVHGRGSLVPAAQLIEDATGRPLSAEPFLTALRDTVGQVHGI